MGEFSKSKDFKIAFVLDENLLRESASLIERNLDPDKRPPFDGMSSAPLEYDVTLAEAGNFTTTALDEVLNLSNSGPKTIRAIGINTAYWASPKIRIRFRVTDFSDNVTYSVSGDERQVFFVSSEIEDFVRRTRVWYTRIAHLDATTAIFGLLFALWLGAIMFGMALAFTGRLDNAAPSTSKDTIIGYGIAIGIVIVSIVLATVLNRLKSWLFPAGIFAVGDGKDVAQKLRFWRRLFGVGILIAAVVNIGTTLLFP